METPRVRLGELLVRAGLITEGQLEEALGEQRRVGKRLGSLLVETGLVSETQVTQILSQQLSVPWVSLHHIDFTRDLLNLIPVDLVERYCLIPIYVRRVRGLGDALYIAMDDPTNAQALQEAAERSRLHVRAMIAPPSDIRSAIKTYYGVGVDPAPRLAPAPATPSRIVDDDDEDVPTGIHPRMELPTAPGGPLPEPPPLAARPTAGQLDSAVDALIASDPEAGVETSRATLDMKPPSRVGSVPPARPPMDASPNLGSSPRSSPATAPPPSSPVAVRREDSPPSSRGSRDFGTGKPRGERAKTSGPKSGRMIALTLLDGTTIRVPGKGKAEDDGEGGSAAKTKTGEDQLTTRDLLAALRAASHGADASEVLGENVRWEALFAALLSVLLKKHLITDWEFVEEFKKV